MVKAGNGYSGIDSPIPSQLGHPSLPPPVSPSFGLPRAPLRTVVSRSLSLPLSVGLSYLWPGELHRLPKLRKERRREGERGLEGREVSSASFNQWRAGSAGRTIQTSAATPPPMGKTTPTTPETTTTTPPTFLCCSRKEKEKERATVDSLSGEGKK